MKKDEVTFHAKKFNPKGILWRIIKLAFPGAEAETTWFTWGCTVYHPGHLPHDLAAHEAVHVKQQRNKLWGLIWWIRYIRDPKFRYSQELPAYKEQLLYIFRNSNMSRDGLAKVKHGIATVLSGKQYNHMVKYSDAMHDLNH